MWLGCGRTLLDSNVLLLASRTYKILSALVHYYGDVIALQADEIYDIMLQEAILFMSLFGLI